MIASSAELRDRRRRALVECRDQGLDNEQTGRRLLDVDPDYAPGLLALGTARLTAGELDEAEPLLWRAVEGAPSNPGYYFPLMALCRERGDMPLAKCLGELAMWKTSFYDEIPEGISKALAGSFPALGDAARTPEIYRQLAETCEQEGADEPWPDRLFAFRLLNEVQKQAGSGFNPDLIPQIREHAADCAPLFLAALREVSDTQTSSLSVEAEALVIALLGEIGGVELIDDFLLPDSAPEEAYWHAHWAVQQLGRRFPEAAFARLREAARTADPDMRVSIAQHLYFLPETPGARQAILDLLDGFPGFAADQAAPILLLTVSTLMAMMGSPSDSLAVLKRHERQLPKEGRRLIKDLLEDEEPFVPDFIESGLGDLDIEAVCVDLELMGEEEEDEEFEDDDFVEPEPTVKPGRNEPCWCGSGKKYKKCHLEHDEESARQARSAEDDVFGAWRDMLEASRRYHTTAEVDRAIRIYADQERSDVEPATLAETGFFEWYLTDYRTAPEARTAAEEYLRRRGPRLPERERALVESWTKTLYGLWEAQRVEPGRGIQVKDLFGSGVYFVDDLSTSRTAVQGDCIVGRLHQFEGKWLFAGNVFFVPPRLLARVVELVKAGSSEAGTTEAEFFRSRAHEWRRFVLDEHAIQDEPCD